MCVCAHLCMHVFEYVLTPAFLSTHSMCLLTKLFCEGDTGGLRDRKTGTEISNTLDKNI